MMNEPMTQLLETAVKAALAAGREILDVYSKPVNVEYKDDKSPLTEADKRSHGAIVNILVSTGLPLLSEEGKQMEFSERNNWKIFWLIDPLDGTKEFIKRNGEFTVNIALIKNNYPVMGIIYVPVLNELYFASEEIGSYKCENTNFDQAFLETADFVNNLVARSQRLSDVKRPEKYKVVASRSHMSPETEQMINDLKQKHGEIDLVSKGSSLKLCLVAEGKAHLYPRLAPTMEWDTAAGQAIAELAGCTVINYENKARMNYNKENLLNPWFVVSAN